MAGEWARYRTKAMNAVKRGESVPVFVSSILPPFWHEAAAHALTTARTADDVRAIFAGLQRAQEDAEAAASPSSMPPKPSGNHSGVMVAHFVPHEAAQQLAIPGGEPPEDLHVTLAFLGHAADLTSERLAKLRSVVQQWAARQQPPAGSTTGLGRFNPNPESDGKAPIYASVGAHGLHAYQRSLIGALKAAGFAPSETFAYTPHVTLAYVPEHSPSPVTDVPAVSLPFDTVSVAVGDDRTHFPVGGTPEHPTEQPAGRMDMAGTPTDFARAVAAEVSALTREELAALRAELLAGLAD